jgi:hypothetical protein
MANREQPPLLPNHHGVSYAQGLRLKARMMHLPIFVTDIRPGFVATPMLQGPHLTWVATAETAAAQIFGPL